MDSGQGISGPTGALLARDRVDRYRPFGAFGKPAWQHYLQLRAMLLGRCGEKSANYFAKPTYDPETGVLQWTSEVVGAARGWHEMAPEERAQRAVDLEVIRSSLMNCAQELREHGGNQEGGAAAFSSLLEQATKVPARGNFLYFVGNQPVIAFWGFENQNGSSLEAAAIAHPAGTVAGATGRRWWWWLPLVILAALLAAHVLLKSYDAPTPTIEPLIATSSPEKIEPVAKKEEPVPLPPLGETKQLKPGAGIKIPPGALEKGDLSFLDGMWQVSDRVYEYTDRPDNTTGTMRWLLQFNANGNVISHGIERRDKQGGALPSVQNRARAYTDGNKLYIEETRGAKFECRLLANGRTQCQIVNGDGHRWTTDIRRVS